MLWQLSCASLCLLLWVPVARGLLAVRWHERRARLERQSFVLARAFHRPLYAACLLLVALRVAFLSLIATNNVDEMEVGWKRVAFWLMDMPSVAMAALHGYIVLFAVRLVFRRRWPGATTSAPSGVLTTVFVAFCASLVALVTLVTICRAKQDNSELAMPQWIMFGYTAVIWTTLGVLMLKFEGQAVQILWRYRRRNHWCGTDGVEQAYRRLPVLSFSCLKKLATCSTLLAELLVVRGLLCGITALQSDGGAMDTVDIDSWRDMVLHYFGWELASVVIVLYMLHQTPIVVHYFDDGSRSTNKTEHHNTIPSAPAIDDVEIQIEFQLPGVREFVSDYVVPSNTALIFTQRRGAESDNIVERSYCRVHHSGKPLLGAEYVNCRCCGERDSDQFLSNANVPLLTEEYEPHGTIACESAILTSNSME